jgi:hypothetical protein
MYEINHRSKKHAQRRGLDRQPNRDQKSRRLHRALLRTHPSFVGQSGPVDPQRIERGRDCGFDPRPACPVQPPGWLPYLPSGPQATPEPEQAIGLALHELATNAGRHGALSTGQGRVDISWGTQRGILTISWAEHDGPPVAAPQKRGFGTIVMQAMAERSVAGEVDLRYSSSGGTWRLTCLAANALQPE